MKIENNTTEYNMHESMPLVSVVTVVLNKKSEIEETILSVITQSYGNIEYIVIDGGSNDGTLDIIKKYGYAIDKWISKKDAGIYDAMNKAIDLATGQWINFMNAGDAFVSNSVLNDIFTRNLHKECDILFGDHQVSYKDGKVKNISAGNIENLWKGSQFCHQASFVKLEAHKRRKFNISKKIVADFDFFYESKKSKLRFKRIELFVARCEAGGLSDSKRIQTTIAWWMTIDEKIRSLHIYATRLVIEILKLVVKKVVQ